MEKFNYGNMFSDIYLLVQYYQICAECNFGGELAEYKKKKLFARVDKDLKKHKDDIVPFKYNEIKNVLDCMENHEYYRASIKLCELIDRALYTQETEDKLKALAYLKLVIKYVTHSIDILEINIPSLMIHHDYYDYNLSNETEEVIKKIIFDYSLVELVIELMRGLTPRQIYRLFPIDKEYNVDGMKDYFSCMQEVQKIGLDTRMTHEQVTHYLMECNTNIIIIKLGASIMSLVSDYHNWTFWDMMNEFEKSYQDEKKLRLVVDNTKKK